MARWPHNDKATQHHQSPTTGTPPPPPEEDLYEPPPSYQPPPEFTKPTTNRYEKPVAAQAFPPPQDLTPESFPPNQNIPTPAPFNPPPFHGVQVGIVAKENQPWNSNLFDCMKDPQNAIITLCFPCVTFGQIAEILDNGSTSCATSGILYSCIACCLGVPCLISCGYRSKLRAKFGLVESPAPDCLIHCFCEYCSLCQEYRELKDRGFDPSIGHAGNEARHMRQQYGVTPPMQQRMM